MISIKDYKWKEESFMSHKKEHVLYHEIRQMKDEMKKNEIQCENFYKELSAYQKENI